MLCCGFAGGFDGGLLFCCGGFAGGLFAGGLAGAGGGAAAVPRRPRRLMVAAVDSLAGCSPAG